MIKITNGIVTLDVTPGAYKGIYALQGFHEVTTETTAKAKSKTTIKPDVRGSNLPEVTPNDVTASEFDTPASEFEPEAPRSTVDTDEDLSEIPLGEMNSEQLKAYAKQLGIDIRGLNKRDVRNKIRAAL